MKHRIIDAVVAIILLGGLNLCVAAENKSTAPASATDKNAAAQKSANAKKAPAKVKLLDINSASKAELKTLPGIGDAEADKIIASRPHLSKADLVTQKIIPAGVYLQLKDRVIARQKPEGTPKGAAKPPH